MPAQAGIAGRLRSKGSGMTRTTAARGGGIPISEHSIQVSLVSELVYKLRPEIVRCAIPNGGLRNARVAQQLKAEGLQPGMPDLCFAMEEGRCNWIELKTDKGSLSDFQWGIRRKLENLGHHWALARSVEEALEHLAKWGALK
jgi:VRR-NUC domain